MSAVSFRARTALLASLFALALLIPAGSAQGQTLGGPWAPFAHCPVDDPAMLAIEDGSSYGVACVNATSPSGSFKIGSTVMPTGSTTLQFGVAGPTPGNPALGVIVPATQGKTLVSDPVKVPGGVLGLMCPSGLPLVSELCQTVVDLDLNRVNATVELAGQPTGFSAAGALVKGRPILTLPVKIHLTNPVLGPNCYLGSDANPIVLRPQSTTVGAGSSSGDPNGFSVFMLKIQGSVLGDNTFAVPAATGCGPLGLADSTINQRQGLPSPAGQNELVLNDATANTALTQAGGQEMSDAWHAALLP
jgi:hypothetical protein